MEGGVADALKLCERLAEGDSVCVILRDNIVENDITPFVGKLKAQTSGARLLLKEVEDPERFGVPELHGDRIVRTEENQRPQGASTRYRHIRLRWAHFNCCRDLKPSLRGELEITDVNNAYVEAEICIGRFSAVGGQMPACSRVSLTQAS
jgi:glucose-1-phosphate thymidylyltransferase